MSHSKFLNPEEILATLRELNANISVPLWLFGGVAVDFLVGRWTRSHGDIDLNTFADHRDILTLELHQIGYRTSDSGWLTHWLQADSGRVLEIVFLEQSAGGNAVLHIHNEDNFGIPGLYPTLPNYLDINRFAMLEGVRFRVCSPAGEWFARARSIDVVGGRPRDPKLQHDQRLLETIIPEVELARLRSMWKRVG